MQPTGFYTVKEAADILEVAAGTMRIALQKGRLTAVQMYGRNLISAAVLRV